MLFILIIIDKYKYLLTNKICLIIEYKFSFTEILVFLKNVVDTFYGKDVFFFYLFKNAVISFSGGLTMIAD